MLVMIICYILKRSKPRIKRLAHQLFEASFTLSSFVERNNSVEVFQRLSDRTQTSWRWVLKQKLFDTSSNSFKSKVNFLNWVSWSEEKYSTVLINAMLISKFSSCIKNWAFYLCWRMSLTQPQAVFRKEILILRINSEKVLQSFIRSILSYISRWESEPICHWSMKWNWVVHMIKVFQVPLLQVLCKSPVEVSLRSSDNSFFKAA